MGKKAIGKKGLEKEKRENEERSSLMEAGHHKNGAKLYDEDKANHEISGNGIEFEASKSESSLDVDVDVGKKKKKKKKKEIHEARGDDVELSACEIEPDNVDGDMIKQRSYEKRRENGGNDIDSGARQSEARTESNADKDKRKKKNRKLQEDSGYSADQNNVVVESRMHMDKKKESEDRQMNGEKVDQKKKKKHKRDKGRDDFTEVNNATGVEVGKDRGQTNYMHVDKKKESEYRQMNGEEVDQKKKKIRKRDKGGDDFTAVNNATDVEAGKERGQTNNVHVDKKKKSEDRQTNGEEVDRKKKKKRKRGMGGDDFPEVNNATDVEAGKERGQTNNVHVDKKKKSEDRQTNGEEVDRKKKKKRKRNKGGDDFPEVNNATDVEAGKDRDQTDEKMMENVDNPKRKGKQKHSDTVTAENRKETPKKVSFSDDVEVFPPHEGLVRGKRFSAEEDEIVRNAVLSYIETHQLGEDGLNMVLNCKSHAEVRNCWKEIATALPWRPYESVYYRAHILFERDENRRWTPEELELVRKFHEKHGNEWKKLAVSIGKHRFQVKDAWRRIKLPHRKKGHWSQDEYQNLFELVNLDLRLRATEERKSKHGMLRDNIGWEAISDKLATRSYALCCQKWYYQLTSPLVAEGKWSDLDDYHLVNSLSALDACCIEDVDWDNLLEHRPGNICLKRWNQMVKHLGPYVNKSFAEQVEVLSQRYCSDVLEAREFYNSKPAVDEDNEQDHD